MSNRQRRLQRGQAVVLVALMMTVLLGFVALAVDSARAFEVRHQLQDATDAAALYAADGYQHGDSWTSAVLEGAQLFAQDMRLYGTVSCPTIATPPTTGSSTPLAVVCSVPSPAQLSVYVNDEGADGQSFTYSATYPETLALMQVLGVSPNFNVLANATAVAGDNALAPAIGALGSGTCSAAVSIAAGVNPVYVFGDIATNGTVNVGTSAVLNEGGSIGTRCAVTGAAPTYGCWTASAPIPRAAPPASCAAGSAKSTNHVGGRLADPGFAPPSTTGLSVTSWPGAAQGWPVIVQPGIYANDPQIGTQGTTKPPCYFLSPGVYDFQNGFTVQNGIVSNELRPPLPNPVEKPVRFWGLGGNANCIGDFSVTPTAPSGGQTPVPAGNWSIKLTSLRSEPPTTATVCGTPPAGGCYVRESDPSDCREVTTNGSQVVNLVVSNVPGAQGYNIYAANISSTDCTTGTKPQYAFVKTIMINPATDCPSSTLPGYDYCQSNKDTSGCPSLSVPQATTCTLGQTSYTLTLNDLANFNPNNPGQAFTLYAGIPDDGAGPWVSGRPAIAPPRGNSTAQPAIGDLANVNICARTTSPGVGYRAQCPTSVTPGAAVFYLPNGCVSIQSAGDLFMFSGYQYNWIAVHEPATSNCGTNSLNPLFNSAFEGLFYAPSASVTFASQYASLSPYSGGYIAKTVTISASGVAVTHDPVYSPNAPAVRLTG